LQDELNKANAKIDSLNAAQQKLTKEIADKRVYIQKLSTQMESQPRDSLNVMVLNTFGTGLIGLGYTMYEKSIPYSILIIVTGVILAVFAWSISLSKTHKLSPDSELENK